MVWYAHLFKNFPQFVVIRAVKGFGIVNKADVFLELSLSTLAVLDPNCNGSLIFLAVCRIFSCSI